MVAAKGNDYAKKLKTKEDKDKVYKSYCAWIALGNSKEAWHYDDGRITLTWETVETYIKNDEDFLPIHKKIAETKSLDIWEKKGIEMMEGRVEKSQPAIYQMFMRNKFGWDKQTESKEEAKGAFNQWTKDQKK